MASKLILISAVVSTTFLASNGASEAADSLPPRAKVAVVDALDLPGQMDDTRVRLRELVEAAARERGLDVVPAPGQLACGDTSCLPAIASAAGATDLLVARGGRSASRDYHVELSLWQSATGETVPAVADCSFCTGPQMAEAVAKAARPLLDRVAARKVTAISQPAAPPTAAVSSPAVTPAPDKVETRRGRLVAGWSLVGLGAASAVAGGIIWNLDGKDACDSGSGQTCARVYDTTRQGIAFIALGAVAAGVGLWLALDPFGTPEVTVTVGPSGAALAGRF